MRTAIMSIGLVVAFAATAEVSFRGDFAELTFGDDGVFRSCPRLDLLKLDFKNVGKAGGQLNV